MTREDVIRDNWVDRYLLGQLSDTEQDRFETFYFTCPETQEDIETTQQLIDGFAGNAIAALSRRHQVTIDVATPAATNSGRYNWPALAASLVAAICLGFAINASRSALPSAPLTLAADLDVPIFSLGVTRGVSSAQLVELPDPARRLVFSLDIGGERNEAFSVALLDASDNVVWQADPLTADSYGSVTFVLPPGLLAEGDYRFVATPATRTDPLTIAVLVETASP